MSTRLLILGGTHFLGRHAAEEALRRGHALTLFNRGRSAPDLFPEAERLTGDRDGGLDQLQGRTFDAVLDTSGYVPRVVRQSTDALRDEAGRYLFASSESVYTAGAGGRRSTRTAPCTTRLRTASRRSWSTTAASRWRASESSRQHSATGRSSCALASSLDPTPHQPVHLLGAADARRGRRRAGAGAGRAQSSGAVHRRPRPGGLAARRAAGRHDGRVQRRRARRAAQHGGRAEACAAAAGMAPEVEWVQERFLLDQKVEPWMGLPLWIPDDDPEGLAVFDNRRAVAAGLRFRPATETAADTLAWELGRPPGPLGEFWAGIPRRQERELLAAWRAHMSEEDA